MQESMVFDAISSKVFTAAVWLVPTIFAITVHEAAHGFAAMKCGDDTAKRHGRLTLNPAAHADPVGTALVPLLCLVFGGMLFGWAKPVPVNPARFHYPKKDMFWVALAGPASNFIMAVMWFALARTLVPLSGSEVASAVCRAGVQINLVLMLFNLLPIPPLDGSKVLERFLSSRWKYKMQMVEPYGMWIILFLAMTPVLGMFWLGPLMSFFTWML